MNRISAGWATCDITPEPGLPLGGRGPRLTPARKVLEPLTAQVLILEDAKGFRTLWLSLDLIGMSPEAGLALRWQLSAACAVPLEAVIINFSHTHSGPMINLGLAATLVEKPDSISSYHAWLTDRMCELAREAADDMKAVEVRRYSGTSRIGINRRLQTEAGMEMRPNERGVYHEELWVLELKGDKERCLVFSHGCHPVIVYGYALDAISGEYPAFCRKALRAELGEEVHCQFIQGAAGNVRPRILADLETKRFRKAQPGDAEAVGQDLARDVLLALENEGEGLELDLKVATGSFLLHRREGPDASHWESELESQEELKKQRAAYWLAHPVQALATPWSMGLLQLTHEHWIAFCGGEVVAEWVELLKNYLDKPSLVVWGYCNDCETYLPTDALLEEGGYEVAGCAPNTRTGPGVFKPGIDEALRERVQSLALEFN